MRPPSSALATQVQHSGLAGKVVFPGPTREPESFYQACDVFILPTFYDACSLVVFEAMAAGLPAINYPIQWRCGHHKRRGRRCGPDRPPGMSWKWRQP